MNKAYREVRDRENRKKTKEQRDISESPSPLFPGKGARGGMIDCPRLPRTGRRKEAVKKGPYLASPSLAARARIVS
jgi:hypothetical protein